MWLLDNRDIMPQLMKKSLFFFIVNNYQQIRVLLICRNNKLNISSIKMQSKRKLCERNIILYFHDLP